MGKLTFPLVQVKDPNTLSASASGWSNQNGVHPVPGHMDWKHVGDVTIQGKKWSGDTTISASGDPTTSKKASLGINTGANHDANVLWLGTGSYATERQVRGIYFRTYTNQAKFKPRISGVALRYINSRGAIYYHGLHYRSDGYEHSTGGSLNYEGGDSLHEYWGVGKTNSTDGAHFHNPDMKLQGVLFHMETTWKTGSAEWCYCYIYNLRFICDAKQQSSPYYNNLYRVWGVDVL